MNEPCSIEGCDKPASSRGWCQAHYTRWRRHGDPATTYTPTRGQGIEARFEAKVERMPNGCWHWTGALSPNGYGRFNSGGRGPTIQPHRWSHERWVGPIPEGWTIDHECHNRDASCKGGVTCQHRRCVNPEHLVPVVDVPTNVANSPNAWQNRTHCTHNHEYTPENTYRDKAGRRQCRRCHVIRQTALNKRKRADMTHCGRGHEYTPENTVITKSGRRYCIECLDR